jgi:hypothetical protein
MTMMDGKSLDEPAAAPAWNEFDEMTLSVMANRNHYDKYVKAKTQAQTLAEIFRKEQIYYKERIIELTRELFEGDDGSACCSDTDVKESYRAYMKCCIRYLKWKDITEMIQTEKYSTDVEVDAVADARVELDKRIQDSREPTTVTAAAAAAVGAVEPDDPSPPPPSPPPPSRYNETDRLISFANKMCIRKKTMDDFIVIKPPPLLSPSDRSSGAHLPQIRDYHDEIAKRAAAS